MPGDPTLIDYLDMHSTLHVGAVEREEADYAEDSEYATYCVECESAFEEGEEGFAAILCPDCGSNKMHEIRWVR